MSATADTSPPDRQTPGRALPPWFEQLARYGWAFLGVVGGAAVIVLGLAALRELVVPLLLAGVFAIVFEPAVGWMAERRVPRSIGALAMIAVTAVLIWGSIAIVIVGVADQTDELTERFDQAQREVNDLIEQSNAADLVDRLRASGDASGSTLRDGFGSQIGTVLDSAAAAVSGIVLGTVLLYYLLKDGQELTRQLVSSRDPERAAQNRRIFAQAGSSIRAYFRGKTVLALAQGLFIAVALALMDVPLAGSIGVVNVIGAYIPFLGAFIGGGFAVLMALSDGGLGLAVGALAVVLFTNIVLENVLEPRFLGASLQLHPIIVLLSTVAGGAVAGVLGLVLAAPLTSIGINLYHELQRSGFFDDTEALVRSADGDQHDAGEGDRS
ncbi:MAG: AI-2E family transporter [Acidimicrobiia bacterium]|nr:AI-2E family transporter [Acidimicrobiia bacterium]